MKKRLDTLIFERRKADSREKAQRLIMAGLVLVDGKMIDKAGTKFEEDIDIEVLKGPNYVGRGAEKLKGAVEIFRIDFKGKIVADIGASTGGFTDFALKSGSSIVYAIDVGRGQLDWKLRQDSRVIVMEKINTRYLKSLPEKIDIFLIDVSFISLEKILPAVREIIESNKKTSPSYFRDGRKQEDTKIIVLFKPQFEAGKKIVDKTKGVIKDPSIHQELLENFRKWCRENNFKVLGECESPVLGNKGNKEFFFYLTFQN